MKKISSLMIVVLAMIMILSTFSFAVSFSDLSSSHWCYQTINQFIEKGIINGYEDGTFRQDSFITRAEYVKIVNRYFGYTSSNLQTKIFEDVPSNSWFFKDVTIAVEKGYIKGFEDNTFRPNEPIRRQEAVVILARILGIDQEGFPKDHVDGVKKYKDSDEIQDWAYTAIQSACIHHLIGGYEDGTLRILKNVTRAESVELLSKLEKEMKAGRISLPDDVKEPSSTVDIVIDGNENEEVSKARKKSKETVAPTANPTPTVEPTVEPTAEPTAEPVTTYTITWQDDEGNVLEVDEEVEVNSPVSFDGEEPTKEPTRKTKFTFAGWSKDGGDTIVNIEEETAQEDTVYQAVFEESERTFTVTWVIHNQQTDDFELAETDENVPYGAVPSFDQELTYEVETVVEDGRTYEINRNLIGWVTFLQNPVSDYEDFDAWNDMIHNALYEGLLSGFEEPVMLSTPLLVTQDITYIGIDIGQRTRVDSINPSSTCTVWWKDEDGTLLETDQNVRADTLPTYDGPTPTKEDDIYIYKFLGWSPNVHRSQYNTTYTARYQRIRRADVDDTFTITWAYYKDEDVVTDSTTGKRTISKVYPLSVQEGLNYADIPQYNGPDLKEEVSWKDVTIINREQDWSYTVAPVTENTTYAFLKNYDEFSVFWLDSEGNEIASERYHFGQTPSFKGDLPDGFCDWVNTETGEVGLGPVFERTWFRAICGPFTITWLDEEGNAIEVDEDVPYQSIPSFDGTMPEGALGWLKEEGSVLGPVPVTESTTYSPVYRTYTVTWVKEDRSKNPSVFQLIETDEDVPEGAVPSYDSELPFPLDDIGGVYAFKGYSLTNYNSIEECQEAIENAIEAYQNGEGDELEVIYELVPVDEDITYIIYNEIDH